MEQRLSRGPVAHASCVRVAGASLLRVPHWSSRTGPKNLFDRCLRRQGCRPNPPTGRRRYVVNKPPLTGLVILWQLAMLPPQTDKP